MRRKKNGGELPRTRVVNRIRKIKSDEKAKVKTKPSNKSKQSTASEDVFAGMFFSYPGNLFQPSS